MMAATGRNGYTISLGPGSYTAVLIESLKELLQQGKAVSTWELAQTIMKKHEWKGKSNLHAVVMGSVGRHIMLAPPRGPDDTDDVQVLKT